MTEWAALERFGHAVQRARWRFAVTMPNSPHHYTLREDWADDDEFVWAVEHLRATGYSSRFGGRPYTQLDVNEHFYWTMGAPVAETTLINRKRRPAAHPYDGIAARYDVLFRDDDALAENNAVLNLIESRVGPINDHTVLDVGCGNGLLLDYRRPASYVGIDPSVGMVDLLRHRHPGVGVVVTDLARYVPPISQPHPTLIVALFGTATYLTDSELARVWNLADREHGTAILMFYNGDEQPRTYRATGITPPRHTRDVTDLPGDPSTLAGYDVVTYRGDGHPL